VPTPLGAVRKTIRVLEASPRVELEYDLDWASLPAGSLRLGHVTLNPATFDPRSLCYACANGGRNRERFTLGATAVDHGAPVSFLVSASAGLGLTDGSLELGDARRSIRVDVDTETAPLVGLVSYRPVGDTFFFRAAFSARELDETCRETDGPPPPLRLAYTLPGEAATFVAPACKPAESAPVTACARGVNTRLSEPITQDMLPPNPVLGRAKTVGTR